MPVRIRNLTSRPLLLSLNSGATLRLAPGATSGEVSEAEVTDNAKVGKLQGRRLIAVERIEHKVPAPARKRGGPRGRARTEAPAPKDTATPVETKPAAAAGE